jgi:transcriptional regulator with XRE-family HTH domain
MTARQMAKAREALGWSQARLAEALGVHPMTVSKWERDQQPIPTMAALAVRCLAEHSA